MSALNAVFDAALACFLAAYAFKRLRRHLGQGGAIGAGDGHAACHRLEHRKTEPFVKRRQHEQTCTRIEVASVLGMDVAEVTNDAPKRGAFDPLEPRAEAFAVTLRKEKALSSSGMNSPLPANILRSE